MAAKKKAAKSAKKGTSKVQEVIRKAIDYDNR